MDPLVAATPRFFLELKGDWKEEVVCESGLNQANWWVSPVLKCACQKCSIGMFLRPLLFSAVFCPLSHFLEIKKGSAESRSEGFPLLGYSGIITDPHRLRWFTAPTVLPSPPLHSASITGLPFPATTDVFKSSVSTKF
uniref:Uncharacterized protein n=1 Tax=Sphaerodactylus townsendi TaxID=933632 RepID=A0ACB8GAE3_9SAUR